MAEEKMTKRILWADADIDMIEDETDALENIFNCLVTAAYDGWTALNELRKKQGFDLIILGIMMSKADPEDNEFDRKVVEFDRLVNEEVDPGDSGIAILKWINKQKSLEEIPVIILSNRNAEEIFQEEIFELTGKKALGKNFSFDDPYNPLFQEVEKHFTRKKVEMSDIMTRNPRCIFG